MNREEQTMLNAYQNGTIDTLAAEYARINPRGFKYNWTVEQHAAWLTQKAQSLATENQQPARASLNTRLGHNSFSSKPMPGTADYDLFVDHGE